MPTHLPGSHHRVHAASIRPLAFPNGAIVASLDGRFVGMVGTTRIANGGQLVLVRNPGGAMREFADFELEAANPEQHVAYEAKVEARN